MYSRPFFLILIHFNVSDVVYASCVNELTTGYVQQTFFLILIYFNVSDVVYDPYIYILIA